MIYPLDLPADQHEPEDDAPRVVVARSVAGQVAVVATNPADHEQPLSLSLTPLATTGSATPGRVSLDGPDPSFSTPQPIQLEDATLTDTLPAATITTYLIGPSRAQSPGPGAPIARECTMTPTVEAEGVSSLRAAGVSCEYALRFAKRSKLCSPTGPTTSASCTDEGWVCAVGPTLPGQSGLRASCTKGKNRIAWQAGY
jgi:hypothetical protein